VPPQQETNNTQNMKNTRHHITKLLLATAMAATLTTGHAATLLDAPVHADIGIGWDDMATGSARWDLHIHQEEPTEAEFAPDEAIFYVNEMAFDTSPGGVFEAILGPMGTANWIIPQNLNTDVLFLGIGSEEMPMTGLFVGNQFTLSLESASGPGHIAVYQTDGFGSPTAFFNTRDGLTGADTLTVPTGGHEHYSFAFSAHGTYTLNLKASGTLVDGNEFTESDIATYTFQVVPEPSTWALMTGGAAALVGMMRRRRAA